MKYLFIIFLLPILAKASDCNLPVCSIEHKILELRAMSSNERGMYAINLNKEYAKENNTNYLNNLYDLAIEMQKLFVSLGDEDWIVKAANDLASNMVVNLSKYSKIDGEYFITLYQKLSSQAFRYDMISYWSIQMESIEVLDDLSELVTFSLGAKRYSQQISDEEWVSRSADQLANKLSIKMNLIDPFYEGIYSVSMINDSNTELNVDRIIILESSSTQKITVNFINDYYKKTVFKFTDAKIANDKIFATNLSSNQSTKGLELSIDRKSGKLKGTVIKTNGQILVFEGEQIFSTKDALSSTSSFLLEEIEYSFVGSISNIDGTLSLKSFSPNTISATFISDDEMIVIHFLGKIISKRGIIYLSHKDEIKIVLSVHKNTELSLVGKYFSIHNSNVFDCIFLK